MGTYIQKFGHFALLGIIPLAMMYLLVTEGGIRPLLTDSVSFDYKADVVAEADLERVDVMGLGSSIALNNIGSRAMQTYLGEEYTYFNFSSWGLTMRDLNIMLPVLIEKYNPKVLLVASGPMDFEKPKVGMCTREEFAWYIENKNLPYLFMKNSNFYGILQRKRTLNKYTKYAIPEQRIHLLLDEWGGSNLRTLEENYQWFRYNEDLQTETVDMQFEELAKLAAFAKTKNTHLIFVASPMKKDPNCVDKACQEFVKNHIARTRKIIETEGFTFLDMHSTHKYPDSLFCDESHLVNAGPDKLSRDILDRISLKDLLRPSDHPVVSQ